MIFILNFCILKIMIRENIHYGQKRNKRREIPITELSMQTAEGPLILLHTKSSSKTKHWTKTHYRREDTAFIRKCSESADTCMTNKNHKRERESY